MKGNIKLQVTYGWHYTRGVAVDFIFGLQRKSRLQEQFLVKIWKLFPVLLLRQAVILGFLN